MRHMSVLLHVITVVVIFGKSAVASAGLTLATLGAFNVVIEFIAHGWVIGGKSLPLVVGAAGLLGGIINTVAHDKSQ
jgi:hypothetical protein